MNLVFECAVCRQGEQTLRCARCQATYYCSKEHQRQDWKIHKISCQKPSEPTKPAPKPEQRHAVENHQPEKQLDANQNHRTVPAITYEGSSENEILTTQTQTLSNFDFTYTKMPPQQKQRSHHPLEELRDALRTTGSSSSASDSSGSSDSTVPDENESVVDQISRNVIHDLETFGVCVVDNFLGLERGTLVLNEVLSIYKSGVFKDGQLVSSTGRDGDHKTIRGDQIAWLGGNEGDSVTYIGQLIRDVDSVIKRANKMSTGRLSHYTINGRTKAMVACYPGSGAHYVKHVDNPNNDGRCVTAIYYLNRDWDAKRFGGLLRIFPEGSDKVADIEPLFDRLLFFWSDRSNPHEVQPAFQTRYAITLWYFDAHEREQACKRFENSNKPVKEGEV